MAKKALLLGINNYKYLSNLRGCVNDVRLMKNLLKDVYQFSDDDILALVNGDVVQNQVIEGLEWLFEGARNGDQLLLHFSGHGSYTVDQDGDEPKDELLCLCDMDWSNRSSYLLDDDLRRWSDRKPEGASLTVILDCCHAGTGTRKTGSLGIESDDVDSQALVDLNATLNLFFKRSKSKRSMLSKIPLMRSHELEEHLQEEFENLKMANKEQKTVLARFQEPPLWVRQQVRRDRTVRSLMRDTSEEVMNHILLAGARDDQTAADAFIESDYYGAFTYNLCSVLRENHTLALRHLIKEVGQRVIEIKPDQTPQLEPHHADGEFLSGSPRQMSGTSSNPEGQLHLVCKEVTSLVSALRELTSAISFSGVSDGRTESVSRGERSVVYVHGIGSHDVDFSEKWWDSVLKYNRDLDNRRRVEVLWSDLVNRSAVLDTEEAEARRLAERIESNLRGRLEEKLTEAMVQNTEDTARGTEVDLDVRGVLDGFGGVDDFARYMMSSQVRSEILRRFIEKVEPLLRDGAVIDVIGHSWGTVVAYEGLRQLSDRSGSLSGRVANLFTVGSALSIGAVRENLFDRVDNGQKPSVVAHWINLDAEWDVVGGALRSHYGVDQGKEFLNLEPVGCSRRWLGYVNPVCAHSSYFHKRNVKVNRDIFGRFLQ